MKLQKAKSIINQHRAAVEKLEEANTLLTSAETKRKEVAGESLEWRDALARNQEVMDKLNAEITRLDEQRAELRGAINDLRVKLSRPIPGLVEATRRRDEAQVQHLNASTQVTRWAKDLMEARATVLAYETEEADRVEQERRKAEEDAAKTPEEREADARPARWRPRRGRSTASMTAWATPWTSPARPSTTARGS